MTAILKELRDLSAQAVGSGIDFPDVSCRTLDAASDEIERLTKLLIDMRGAIQCVCPDHPIMKAALEDLSKVFLYSEEDCPGHVASQSDGKICGNCGIHVDSLRPPEADEE